MTISLEKYKWLSEQQHNAILESDKVNNEIAKSLAGNEGERIIARLLNGHVVHDVYDVLADTYGKDIMMYCKRTPFPSGGPIKPMPRP